MNEYISAVLDRPQAAPAERSVADEAEEYLRWYAEGAHTRASPTDLVHEKYARSLTAIRALGEVAITGALDGESGRAAQENVKRDVETSVAEMYENNPAFRGTFEISDSYTYPIVGGKVHLRTKDGLKPMVQLVRDGAAASRAAARTEPWMTLLAERDEADVYNAERVDRMARGETGANTRLVVSRDLGQAIKRGAPYKKKYEELGYREGLAFLQLYFADGGELAAGTFSVDNVSDEVFDIVFAEYRAAVPAGMHRSNSVQHGVERTFSSREEAIAFAMQFRQRCYALQNDRRSRRSVSQFIRQHDAEVSAYVNSLFVPLGKSLYSGVKDGVLHTFVRNLLSNTRGMRPDVVDRLCRIHGSTAFNDEDGRFMLEVALYAVAEALYDGARRFAAGEAPARNPRTPNSHTSYAAQGSYMPLPLDMINRQLTMGVHAGVSAGREYKGACAGRTSLANPGEGADARDPLNPQGAFGGREGENKESASLPDDKYGSRTFKCPNKTCGRENTRPYNTLLERCQHCKKEIKKC